MSDSSDTMWGGHMPKVMDIVAMRGRGRMVLVRQSTKDGVIPCEVGGGMRSELPGQQNTQRKGAREWSDMPDSDNGEYP